MELKETQGTFEFSVGQHLLCYDRTVLYEAKCLQRRMPKSGCAQYFIHYKGWNNKYDEWVEEDRVVKANKSNVKLMAYLKRTVKKSTSNSTNISSGVTDIVNLAETIPMSTGIIQENETAEGTEANEETTIIEGTEANKEANTAEGIVANKETNTAEGIVANTETNTAERTETNEETKIVEGTEANKEANTAEGIVANKEITQIAEGTVANKQQQNTIIETADFSEDEDIICPLKPIPKINFPSLLLNRLACDDIMIKQYKKVIHFSEINNVNKLIIDFIYAHEHIKHNNERENALNIGFTLFQFFNLEIHKSLLYSEECMYGIKEQAQRILEKKLCEGIIKFDPERKFFPNNMLHHVYGPSYLLRLINDFPRIISLLKYDEGEKEVIFGTVHLFLKFIEDNFDRYFDDAKYVSCDADKRI